MYSCMLPFRVWDLPNQMLNCEDVLMNMIVSVASGSPYHTFSGVAYQPAHGVQDDYGTPPPAELKGEVKVLAGLSGVINNTGEAWAGTRTGCTNALAGFFDGARAADEPLLGVPAFMASPTWRRIPFEKRWVLTNQAAQAAGGCATARCAQGNFAASLRRSANSSRSGRVHSRRAEQPEQLSKFTQMASAGDGTGSSSGLTNRSLEFADVHAAQRWGEMKHVIEDDLVLGMLKWEADVKSSLSTHVPTSLTRSETCPSREDVMNTALSQRWLLWDDGPECVDGCWVADCEPFGPSSKVAPCCVRRLAARWAEPCEQMPFGCPSSTSLYARKDIVVGDMGLLATPTSVVNSTRCPYRGEVANTRPSDRWRIWHDGTPPGIMGGGCLEGCAMQNCRGGLLNPCCVRRLKVESWPMPCESLRFGCSAKSPRNVLVWARRGEKAVSDAPGDPWPWGPYSISREHPEEELWR